MILDQKALSALDDLSLQFDEVAHVVLASANIDDAVYRLSSRLVAAVVDATKIAYDLVREAANDDLLVGQAAGSTS
jgi:hypothetical protein